MSAIPNSTVQSPTHEAILSEGFTPEQIEMLESLRADYPLSEFVTSSREQGRLRLLKWMREQGRIAD